MNPSNLHDFTQKQIQDENVRLGEARCANESRAKAAWTRQNSCEFVFDGVHYQLPLPAGKSRDDLLKHILQFFAVA
jgi:hypothetical protein